MAMIGRGAAIAEVGAHRHELHGVDRVLRLARRARGADDRACATGSTRSSPGAGTTSPPRAARRCSTAADAAQIDWDEDRGAVPPSP